MVCKRILKNYLIKIFINLNVNNICQSLNIKLLSMYHLTYFTIVIKIIPKFLLARNSVSANQTFHGKSLIIIH